MKASCALQKKFGYITVVTSCKRGLLFLPPSFQNMWATKQEVRVFYILKEARKQHIINRGAPRNFCIARLIQTPDIILPLRTTTVHTITITIIPKDGRQHILLCTEILECPKYGTRSQILALHAF